MEILISFILPFILLLTVVVFIHEYGHYYFAKKYGVGVTDFSIGFGKELFGFNDKSGTRWKFCAIPLGGYVKFFGDRNVFSQAEQDELLKEYNEEDQKKLFVVKPIYQRSLIVAAGPLANFILARFRDRHEAEACDFYLQSQGIIVRRVSGYNLPAALRITVGDESACRRVVHAIRQFKNGKRV